MNPGIRRLLQNPASFLAAAPSDGVCISSRIRLSRNLAGTPFPTSASAEEAVRVVEEVKNACARPSVIGCPECLFFDISSLDDMEKQVLTERRLASADLIASPLPAAVAVSGDESCAVMVNEEDHLRMQVLHPGFRLEECWKQIAALDDELGAELDFAWDDELGYLTACPTNLGTGMRASVMLHLPGLVMTGEIGATVHGISKLGLAVRGIYGEGSDNLGRLYQVSNQITLGESEESIIEQLSAVIRQIVEYERRARMKLLKEDRFSLLDHVGRAYGSLQNCYRLSVNEALESLSGIRLGVELGLFQHLGIGTVNELFVELAPGHLQVRSELALPEDERNILRARLFRTKLRERS